MNNRFFLWLDFVVPFLHFSFCLCLYGLILPKSGRFFLLSTFDASASVGHSFFVIFYWFVSWEFMWVMVAVTSISRTATIVFRLSLLIVPVSTFPIIFGVSASCRFFRAALRKPEEALFRYHYSFQWNILIDFSSSFFQSLSHDSIKMSQISFS